MLGHSLMFLYGGRGDSIIFCRALLIFLPSIRSEMSLNIFFCSKCWTRILMGVCDVSLIISHEIPCKMFSNNPQNCGSSHTEDKINEAPLTLSVLLWENQLMKNKTFHGAVQPNGNKVFARFDRMKFTFLNKHVFNFFVLQNTAEIFDLNLKNKFSVSCES